HLGAVWSPAWQSVEYCPIEGVRQQRLEGSASVLNLIALSGLMSGRQKLLSTVELVQVLLSAKDCLSLYTVTRRSQELVYWDHSTPVDPWARSLWSMGRCLTMEARDGLTTVWIDSENGMDNMVRREVEELDVEHGVEVV